MVIGSQLHDIIDRPDFPMGNKAPVMEGFLPDSGPLKQEAMETLYYGENI